jgi:hypothetical protein
MNVFVSWSGNRSRFVAEMISEWLKCVIQSTRPWISTQDLDSGSIWFNGINEQLRSTSIGIICITDENKNNPWILFETGALAKGLETSKIYTLLIDLEEKDLRPPLSQFNHTFPQTAESIKKLVISLNRLSGPEALDSKTLDRVFDVYWPSFSKDFTKILKENPPSEKAEKRSEKDILTEILYSVRHINQRVSDMEKRTQKNGAFDLYWEDEKNSDRDIASASVREIPAKESGTSARAALNAALEAARNAVKSAK